jgi:hypothetical protein
VFDSDFFSAGGGGVAIAIFFGSGVGVFDSVMFGFCTAAAGFSGAEFAFEEAATVFGSVMTGLG